MLSKTLFTFVTLVFNLVLKITKEGYSRKLFHPLSDACWNDLSQMFLFILSTDCQGLLIIYC